MSTKWVSRQAFRRVRSAGARPKRSRDSGPGATRVTPPPESLVDVSFMLPAKLRPRRSQGGLDSTYLYIRPWRRRPAEGPSQTPPEG